MTSENSKSLFVPLGTLTVVFTFFVFYKWLPLLCTILFTYFILDISNSFLKNKRLSIGLFFFIFSIGAIGLAQLGIYIKDNFDALFDLNLDHIKPFLLYLKIKLPANLDVNYLLKVSLEYIKTHLTIVSTVGANSLQVLVGIIFGILFFIHPITHSTANKINNLWDLYIYRTSKMLLLFFNSFKMIMKLQVTVAVMNTLSLSVLAFIVTPLVTGDTLPYWYILLPLTAVLSLLPVVGNLIINIFIFIVSINVSISFSIVALVYFFLIHKMELVVIGKLLGNKANVPFLFIAISMLLGELVLNSMLGVLFGITILLFIRELFLSIKITDDTLSKMV